MKEEHKKSIREISPIDVYKLLPRTNCAECGEANCMAFATRVVNGEAVIEGCPPILTKKYEKDLSKLQELLAPPVRAVHFGTGDHQLTIGGKHVLYRHEFTYQNPPPIAIDISDDMENEQITSRIKKVQDFAYTYIGRPLSLDALAVRSVTQNPERYSEVIQQICGLCNLPLILCSTDPAIIQAGLSVCAERKPLIFAITKENWKEMG